MPEGGRHDRSREIISYGELSERYLAETGEGHAAHGTWDVPLGELNGLTHAAGLPAISALVSYRINPDDPDSEFVPPSDEFWGTPGVPQRPPNAEQRFVAWMGLVNAAHKASWPEALPGLV